MEYPELKAKFLKTYDSVPEPLRDEIITALGTETFTWRTAKVEIERDTPSAKKIIAQLHQLQVI